nr:unnamed protein product [Callosobruchus analis]
MHLPYIGETTVQAKSNVQQVLEQLEFTISKNETFLLVNYVEANIVVFSCATNMELLCQQETVFMDGTFNYCAKFPLQLFTIHTFVNNVHIPVEFCLSRNKLKSTQHYSTVLRHLKVKCSEMEQSFIPSTVATDFEIGIHRSVQEVFPYADIIGCWFHLSPQSEIAKWLKNLFGLSFLNSEEVGDCLVEDFISIKPQDSKGERMLNYFVDTYVDNDTTFTPRIWVARYSSLTRTTNACESFHSELNAESLSPRPNIYLFLKTLLDMQTDTYIRINSVKK